MRGKVLQHLTVWRDRLPRTRLSALLTALCLYVIAFMAVLIWLAMNGDDTRQRRMAHSPSITVDVQKPAMPPPSYTVPRADEAPVPLPTEPDARDDMPLLPVTQPDKLPKIDEPPAKPPLPAVTDQATPAQPAAALPKPAALPPAAADESSPAPTIAATQPPATVSSTVPRPTVEPTDPSVVINSPEEAAPPPAWRKQTRLFDLNEKRPRIALIVTNLGIANGATRTAVQNLPANVTLAFQTIAPNITEWVSQARLNGHETLLAIPMEPYDYPQNDPGPQTLLTSLPDKANVQRLAWALARSQQVIGIMPSQGDAFVANAKALAPVMDTVMSKDMVFVDGTANDQSAAGTLATAGHIPFAKADVLIDAAASRMAIDQALMNLETLARRNGYAVGIALPYPVTFERLNEWIKTLPQKGIVLAPISAVLTNTAPAQNPTAAAPTATPAPAAAKPAPRPLSYIKRR